MKGTQTFYLCELSQIFIDRLFPPRHIPAPAMSFPQVLFSLSKAQASCRPNVLVQKADEFVIISPRGHHAGFNLGLNCAAGIDFALDSWLELGKKAKVCLTCVVPSFWRECRCPRQAVDGARGLRTRCSRNMG